MLEKFIVATSQDGLVEYVQTTPQLVNQCLDVMRKSFYIHENVFAAFELGSHPECFDELDSMTKAVLNDGVSIAAVDKASGLVVGVSINKIHVQGGSDFTEKLSFKHTQSKNALRWMRDMDQIFDMHEHCKVQSIMELMFVCILPDFRKRGIAKKLFEVSIELAKTLKAGKDVRVAIDLDERLNIFTPPEVVTVACTSLVTQKIARDMNFQIADRIRFDKFGSYDGINLGEAIAPPPESLTYEFIRI